MDRLEPQPVKKLSVSGSSLILATSRVRKGITVIDIQAAEIVLNA
jgi:hypothetical protein